jgi:hypothetical protein
VTPGLPPILQPTKKKSSSMLPVIIGVVAAVVIGGAGVTFLFVRSPDESGAASTDSSTNPQSSASAGAGGGAARGDPQDPGADGGHTGDGGSDSDVEKVEVTIKCVPACDEILIDNEKVEDLAKKLELLPGKHTVKASKAGYITRSETIDVEVGKPFEKEYPLIKIQRGPPRPKPCSQFIRPCK